MHGVQIRQGVHHHGVARLVIGGEPALVLGDHPAVLFGSRDDLDDGLLQVGHGDGLLVPASGQQGRLVQQVFQVCAGKAGGALGQLLQVHILRQGLVLGVDGQDLLAALDIRQAHIHLAVEPSGAQQGRVQNVHPVGGGQDHHALVGGKAVHFHQQLIQGLLPLVVAAAQAAASLAAHSVDLVDKNDSRGVLLGLAKQVPDPGRTHAYIHLHKIGAGDGKEFHPCFTGHGLGQQGLAGARRAHQQHALGDAGPQGQVFIRLAQELHDLPELLLLLVGARHITEGNLAVLGHVLDPGVAEV